MNVQSVNSDLKMLLFMLWFFLCLDSVAVAAPPPLPPGSGNCTDVSSTGFTVSYKPWPIESSAAYVGLFRNGNTPLSQPSALLMAVRSEASHVPILGNGVGAVASAHGLLVPATTYTIRWRFRPVLNDTTINLGFGWGAWGAPFNCTTLNATMTAGASSPSDAYAVSKLPRSSSTRAPLAVGATNVDKGVASARSAISARPARSTAGATAKAIRLYRSSEFTLDDVDFLSNHSSADERGEVRFVSPAMPARADSMRII
jgi:hypothetical protein